MNNPFVQGLVSGLSSNEAQRVIDKKIHERPDQLSLFETLHTTICELLEAIRLIANHYEHLDEPPYEQLLTLQSTKTVELKTRGRRHNMIFVPNGSTQISARIPGLGPITFTPATGWTALDFRDGTELGLASGNDQNIILRLSNSPIGVNAL